jgi:hypothetical protein
MDIGTVEDVAGAVGIDDAVVRHIERRQEAVVAVLVVPDHPVLAERDAADPAAAALQVGEHLAVTEIHLLAQPLGDDRDVDMREKLMRVRAQPAAVERGQDAAPAAGRGVMDRGVGLVAVEMERPAAVEVQRREGVQVMVVAAAHDGALAAVRHDEGERGFAHLPVMDRDAVLRRHVDEHAPEPVVGDLGEEVRRDPELGAGESRRDGVAAKRDRVFLGDRLLVAGRDLVRQEGDVDIGLADEQGFHGDWLRWLRPC